MQKFTDYVRQPSNWEDFVTLFTSEAKFRPIQPLQPEKKEYFKKRLDEIMQRYLSYLIRQGLIEAKSDSEVVSKIRKNEIQHGDLVMHFTGWLDLADTVFVYEIKPKPVPVSKPLPPKTYSQKPEAIMQHASLPKNNMQRPPNQGRIAVSQTKKQSQANSTGPYVITKINHNTSQPTHAPQPQPKSTVPTVPHYAQQKKVPNPQTSHNTIPNLYTPNVPEDNKPFRLRLYQKLADYFEYPQRSVSIKQDIQSMMAHRKG